MVQIFANQFKYILDVGNENYESDHYNEQQNIENSHLNRIRRIPSSITKEVTSMHISKNKDTVDNIITNNDSNSSNTNNSIEIEYRRIGYFSSPYKGLLLFGPILLMIFTIDAFCGLK